jgi:hypothetical protein
VWYTLFIFLVYTAPGTVKDGKNGAKLGQKFGKNGQNAGQNDGKNGQKFGKNGQNAGGKNGNEGGKNGGVVVTLFDGADTREEPLAFLAVTVYV